MTNHYTNMRKIYQDIDTTNTAPTALQAAASPVRSEAVREIISHDPGFLERWALLIFIGIMMVAAIGAWLMKYPQLMEVEGTLITVDGRTAATDPHVAKRCIVQLTAAAHSVDRIRSGQNVQLRGESSATSGFVTGVVDQLPTTSGKAFQLSVELPKGLHTTTGMSVDWHSGVPLRILIHVGDARLLQRFYEWLSSRQQR